MKKEFFILIILLLSHCGFTPVYNSNKIDYKINITEIDGDKIINNILLTEIKRISSVEAEKVFNIKIDTNYEKIIISKDIKGSATDYQLIVTTNFYITQNKITEKVTYQEKQNIKKNSNFFEQKNYENTIKKGFVDSLVRKLNLELSSKR